MDQAPTLIYSILHHETWAGICLITHLWQRCTLRVQLGNMSIFQ